MSISCILPWGSSADLVSSQPSLTLSKRSSNVTHSYLHLRQPLIWWTRPPRITIHFLKQLRELQFFLWLTWWFYGKNTEMETVWWIWENNDGCVTSVDALPCMSGMERTSCSFTVLSSLRLNISMNLYFLKKGQCFAGVTLKPASPAALFIFLQNWCVWENVCHPVGPSFTGVLLNFYLVLASMLASFDWYRIWCSAQ